LIYIKNILNVKNIIIKKMNKFIVLVCIFSITSGSYNNTNLDYYSGEDFSGDETIIGSGIIDLGKKGKSHKMGYFPKSPKSQGNNKMPKNKFQNVTSEYIKNNSLNNKVNTTYPLFIMGGVLLTSGIILSVMRYRKRKSYSLIKNDFNDYNNYNSINV
jgi:hypothetical protein